MTVQLLLGEHEIKFEMIRSRMHGQSGELN